MVDENSRILNFLASLPGLGHSTVEKKDLKEIMLTTGGRITAQGRLYDITAKHLGAGVYRISTKLVNL